MGHCVTCGINYLELVHGVELDLILCEFPLLNNSKESGHISEQEFFNLAVIAFDYVVSKLENSERGGAPATLTF